MEKWGCDASILLYESIPKSEMNARPNAGSARGFEVIDQIKSEIEKAGGRSVVSSWLLQLEILPMWHR
ncbi:hypothetical protein SAY87_031808 [Trapa incisa]|uniref:peroxidase n=1 Tax=Trapa incisa TaxID=236973 RepID=A0AAN7KXW5_9MYRT|nr:hypothetical protein SAY87_031808 [Trapa incisa]